MHDFDERLDRLRVDVQRALDTFVESQQGAVLDISQELRPTLDALTAFLSGGKRFRPACCYWGFLGAGGTDGPAIVAAAASLELLQASALIHDDVMDNSDTRRGMPAVHRRFTAFHEQQAWQGEPSAFGAAAAILIGDLALAWTDTLLYQSGFDDAALHRAKPVFDRMRTELMAGQFLDVLEQSRGGGSVERARRVMRYKTTAYTIERPLHLGAALAGGDDAVFDAYTAFGVPLGEAFQLRDDLLGVFGDPALTGKPAGDDLREGKRTILIAIAQERADAAQRHLLDAAIGRADLTEADVAAVRSVLVATGAVDEVEERIAADRELALAALSSPAITPAAAEALHDLAVAATDRSA